MLNTDLYKKSQRQMAIGCREKMQGFTMREKGIVEAAHGIGCDDGEEVDNCIAYINQKMSAKKINHILISVNFENSTNFVYQD